MTVLMEQKHTSEYGHAWDQFGENVEILGRAPWPKLRRVRFQRRGIPVEALLACSLPAEHLVPHLTCGSCFHA